MSIKNDLLNTVLKKLPIAPKISKIDVTEDYHNAIRLNVGRKRFRIAKLRYSSCGDEFLVEEVEGGILSCNESAKKIDRLLTK